MDYVPWPEMGCTLEEARKRVTRHVRPKPDRVAQNSENHPDEDFLDLLRRSRLVGFGRERRSDAKRRLIDTAVWSEIHRLDWDSSSVAGKGACPLRVVDIRVFPALLAPCRVDLVEGRSLADVFKELVLRDPEVEALGVAAMQLTPIYKSLFVDGRCFVYGVKEWAVDFDRWRMIDTVHPDPSKRSRFETPRPPDALEVVIAVEALHHRYQALIRMLRRSELEAHGLAASGNQEVIMHSVWSHEDFSINAATGDVLQTNMECKNPRYDRLIRRWIAAALERGKRAEAFHVERIMPHGALPSTSSNQASLPPARRNSRRIETKQKSYQECLRWLVEMMQTSPLRRTQPKPALCAKAKETWPGTLSERAFERAWAEAVRDSGATAWSAAGAPRKR